MNLPGHGLIPDDGPRDKLGEKRDIEPHIQNVLLCGRSPPVDVDNIAQCLKGVERDADRQADVHLRHRQPQQSQILAQEPQVLEDEQHRQVPRCRRCQRGPGMPPSWLRPPPQKPVEGDGAQQEQYPHRLPPGVEEEGHQYQQYVSCPPPPEQGTVIEEQRPRQEEEYEFGGGKDHCKAPSQLALLLFSFSASVQRPGPPPSAGAGPRPGQPALSLLRQDFALQNACTPRSLAERKRKRAERKNQVFYLTRLV